jgi:hypothetical protein
MDKDQWYSSSSLTLLVDEVHVYFLKAINANIGLELREFIELGFLQFPVEIVLPICRQPLDIRALEVLLVALHERMLRVLTVKLHIPILLHQVPPGDL